MSQFKTQLDLRVAIPFLRLLTREESLSPFDQAAEIHKTCFERTVESNQFSTRT